MKSLYFGHNLWGPTGYVARSTNKAVIGSTAKERITSSSWSLCGYSLLRTSEWISVLSLRPPGIADVSPLARSSVSGPHTLLIHSNEGAHPFLDNRSVCSRGCFGSNKVWVGPLWSFQMEMCPYRTIRPTSSVTIYSTWMSPYLSQ